VKRVALFVHLAVTSLLLLSDGEEGQLITSFTAFGSQTGQLDVEIVRSGSRVGRHFKASSSFGFASNQDEQVEGRLVQSVCHLLFLLLGTSAQPPLHRLPSSSVLFALLDNGVSTSIHRPSSVPNQKRKVKHRPHTCQVASVIERPPNGTSFYSPATSIHQGIPTQPHPPALILARPTLCCTHRRLLI
jgi:hypothetical protein